MLSPGDSRRSISPRTVRAAAEIGVVAAAIPAVWGLGQLGTGWLSDSVGRKPLIVLGMLVQAGRWRSWSPAAVTSPLGCRRDSARRGTALVYPTLIAAVSDASEPRDRAQA